MKFPVLIVGGVAKQAVRCNPAWPRSVPWGLVADRADLVHEMFGRGPDAMARDGGISPWGLVALLDGVLLKTRIQLSLPEVMARLVAHVDAYQAAQDADEGPAD